MKSISAASASLVLVLGLAGCATTGNVASAPESSGASTPASTSEPAIVPVETPEPDPTPTEDGPAKFGETFAYEDKITIAVAKPTSAMATDSAAGATETAGEIRILTVTITNGTKKVFDPTQFTADLNYGPDGTAASRVFDSAQNLGSGFQGKILPGKKQVARIAFGVPAGPQDILVSIAPSFGHTDALFLGEAVK